MISERYRDLNRQLHEACPTYGTTGVKHVSLISSAISKFSARSLLDYGCGKQTLLAEFPKLEYRAYDPAIPALAGEPEPADIVVCTDVMEHVEPEFVDSVLRHIGTLANRAVVFSISCEEGVRLLADGSNTHRSVHDAEWWVRKLFRIGAVEVHRADAKELVCVVAIC